MGIFQQLEKWMSRVGLDGLSKHWCSQIKLWWVGWLGFLAGQSDQRQRRNRFQHHHQFQTRLSLASLVVVVIFSLTGVMGYHFYNQPQLNVGTIAPQTIKAPKDATIEDAKATEEKRRSAKSGQVSVWVVDTAINQTINQNLQALLDQGNQIRASLGSFPYVRSSVLSTTTQLYLRQADTREWLMILELVTQRGLTNESATNRSTNRSKPQSSPQSLSQSLKSLKLDTSLLSPSQRAAINELNIYRQANLPQALSDLIKTVIEARFNYPIAQKELEKVRPKTTEAIYDKSFLNLSDTDWQAAQVGIQQVLERILTQGIHPGLPETYLPNIVRAQLVDSVPKSTESLATRLLLKVLQANLIKDEEQSRLKAEQAAQAIQPEKITIQRYEVIVKQGEKISQRDFVLLEHFKLSQRGISWVNLALFTSLVSLAVFVFVRFEHYCHPGLRRRDYFLILLLILSIPLLLIFKIKYTSMQAIGLLIGSFYGVGIGVTVVVLMTVLLPIGMAVGVGLLIPSAIGGVLGSLIAAGHFRFPFGDSPRTREELALLSVVVGLAQGLVYFLLNNPISPVWHLVLKESLFNGLSGLAWSIVALGISPYLERIFDVVTPVRLAELANPNRPMLKRLALEAPGTFQHTLFVSTLAEAAARSLGCNVELVRAGTLYHDIGKTHDPMCFIENQMGQPNKHDAINDPWKSADLIKKHVSEGLVMARRCNLPSAIQAFIPEHQGTMLISFFYHQAKQLAEQDPEKVLLETDFRYDGPIPQSRETGIVMLADSCEAALRSLKEATYEEALVMVNKILKARWQDDQLIDSGLAREEMPQIAQIFVQVWQQFHHQRIAYPKLTR